MKIKTSWEIKEWVEESIPENRRDYVDWEDAHFDRFGKEWDELHDRDSTFWIDRNEEVKDLNNILEIIANADNIPNGEAYYHLKKLIMKHIEKLGVDEE